MWHVYRVKCADQSLYTGVAKNVDARVLWNQGKEPKLASKAAAHWKKVSG